MAAAALAWPLAASATLIPRAPVRVRRTGPVHASEVATSSGVGIRSGPGVAAPDLPSPDFTADFSASSPRKVDWASAYANHIEEEAYEITDIEGEIPADLHGTLFRNGPGRLERGHPVGP